MKQRFFIALVVIALFVAGTLAATPESFAQAPAAGSAQNPPAAGQQMPPAGQKTPSTDSGNPFPEDENSIPMMPSKNTPDNSADIYGGGASVPAVDRDPVRSPDDSVDDNASSSGFSSSTSGVDALDPAADDEPVGKHKKKDDVIEPEHPETAKEDLSVGQYYLDNKNWKAALSRYQSALVLDPENPDVFWGLAESERHLGNFADARAHYLKVVEYDPDSRHGKDAAKALKEPELANAKPSGDAAH